MVTTLTTEQKERIELWCQALESGKYQQGKNQLKDGDVYCCLGVACDLSGLGKWYGARYGGENTEPNKYTLPDQVQDWLGLDEQHPLVLDESGAMVGLATLNDTRRYTFPQIAAAIRRTYLEVK